MPIKENQPGILSKMFFKRSSKIENCKRAHRNVLTLQDKTVLLAQHFLVVYENSLQSEVL